MAIAAASLGVNVARRPDWGTCRKPETVLANLYGRFFPYRTKQERYVSIAKIKKMLEGDDQLGIVSLSPDDIWDTIIAMGKAHEESLLYPDVEFTPRSVGLIPYCVDSAVAGRSLIRHSSYDRTPTRLPSLSMANESLEEVEIDEYVYLPRLT